MTILYWVFLPLHVLVCVILIAVVLLQTGKGADIAGVFGGGGTQTAFGPRGVENTLSKLTKYAAVIFMITSLGLSIVQSDRSRSGFQEFPSQDEVEAPAAAPTASPNEAADATPASGNAAESATAVDEAATEAAAGAPAATSGGDGGADESQPGAGTP